MSDDLTTEQSWRGTFWLPGKPDETRQGFLTYTPDHGVSLSFVSGFDDRKRTLTSPAGYGVTQGSGRFPLIHGTVDYSLPVTLLDCRVIHYQSSTDEIHDQDISAQWVLTGVILNDPEAAVFSELAIELENLTEWDRHDEVSIFDSSGESPR